MFIYFTEERLFALEMGSLLTAYFYANNMKLSKSFQLLTHL